MRKWLAGIVLASMAALGTLTDADAQNKKEKKPVEAFTDPDKAGPDFAIQGEYAGSAGPEKLGAQVIADGDGLFTARLLKGGLPGDGWDGKTEVKATGKTDGGKVVLAGAALTGQIADAKLTGKAKLADSELSFTLNRMLRKSATEGAQPPAGATVLFDGSSAEEWNGGKLVEGKLLHMGTTSKKKFKDFKAHVEFRLPFMPRARGQGRGNSGFYLQNRYEVQLLDSFGLPGKDNECGGIYSQIAPSVNMCYPPLSWQTYDVDFKAARYGQDGKKTANARVTILHNGVKIHDDVEIKGSTGGGIKEDDTPGPFQLQNHGNPVYFRNIWVMETK
jgi:Domain of Unknown Function (DUF1080)